MGSVIFTSCFHFPAPSSEDASYSSLGTDCRAARKISMFSPIFFHTERISREFLATSGSFSHNIDSIPKAFRILLKSPIEGLNRYSHTMEIATILVTDGE